MTRLTISRVLAIAVLGMNGGHNIAAQAFRTHLVSPHSASKAKLGARVVSPLHIPRGRTGQRAVPTANIGVFAGEAASLFNNMKVRC